MIDRPIASDLSYEVLQQRRSEPELSTSSLHQPHQRSKATVITGTRFVELSERLGGRQPLANGFIDRVVSHEP